MKDAHKYENLHDRIAKAIADAIGHGIREKCESHADAVMAILDAEGDIGSGAWQEKVNEIANNIGESLNAGCNQDTVDRINVYVDELFALASPSVRSGGVSDADANSLKMNLLPALENTNLCHIKDALTHFVKEVGICGDAEDAARYKWLRDDPPLNLSVRMRDRDTRGSLNYRYIDGPELDRQIDAARKGERYE